MVSTYLSYDLIMRDMKQSIRRVSEQAIVARDAEYYKENIGKVSSLDEFMDDYRLYSYAMKAYGLEEMTYAKAFMKKVLESDLSDDNSFANKLADERYRAFASAFQFSGATATVQTEAQLDELIGLYNANIVNVDAALKEETRYYNIMIDNITSVDQLLNNDRMRHYVFSVFGIDEKTYSRANIKGILTSDLDDPNSYFNTVHQPVMDAAINNKTVAASEVSAATAQKKALEESLGEEGVDEAAVKAEIAALNALISQRNAQITGYNNTIIRLEVFRQMAAAFEFNADGTVPTDRPVQDDATKRMMNEAFVFGNPRVTPTAALLNKAYFEERMATITSVEDIISDKRLYDYVRTAFDLTGVTIVPATIRNILTSDLDDPDSYINTFGKGNENYLALRNAFNFQTDGTLAPGDTAQTADQMRVTSNRYMTRYNDKDDEADEKALKLFKVDMLSVNSVADFLESSAVYNYALKAVGLDPGKETSRIIKQVLTSDLQDPKSFVYTLKDERYVQLAKLFNFTPAGEAGVPVLAQSEIDIQSTAKAYIVRKSAFGTEDEKKLAKEEAEYYSAEVIKLKSLKDLLENPRLLAFTLVAHGIDPEAETLENLYKVFTADIDDPKSYINTHDNLAYRALVTSFNFDTEGKLMSEERGTIQTRRGLYETLDRYMRQTLEEQAGEDNNGVRLALYFQRMAAGITSVYDILGDTALQEFISITFGIPSEMAGSDIDVQAAMIKRYLDIEDIHDPAKLKKLTARFTVMYDMEYNNQLDPVLALMSGSYQSGISADTLATLAQLRI